MRTSEPLAPHRRKFRVRLTNTTDAGRTSDAIILARSVVWNWSGMITTGVVSFVTMPIMIHYLGNFYYGIWFLLNTIIGYYGLLDFGITNSLQRFTSRLNGAGDSDSLRQTVAAALHITAATALIILATTGALAYCLPGVLKIPPTEVQLFRKVLLLMGASVAMVFPARTLGACLVGFQRFDLYNLGVIVGAVMRGALIVAALRMGHGVIAVAVITCGTSAFSLLLYLASVLWLDRHLVRGFGTLVWPPVRQLFGFSFFVFLRSVGDYFRFHLDSLVIVRYLGVALVTPFGVAASLMSYFMSVMYSISTPLMTEQGRLDGAQRYSASREFFLRGTKLTASFAVLGGLLLICNGRLLLQLWLGKQLVSAYPILVVLTLAYISDLGQGPSINLLFSRGRHQWLAYWTVLEGIANLLLSIYLAGKYGSLGVALGTAIPMLVTKLIVQPWYVLRVSDTLLEEYLPTVARPIMAGMVCAALYTLVPPLPATVGTLLLSISSQALVFSLITYTLVLNREERRSVAARFMSYMRPMANV
jgi:O-antigen/teichoic acid export membrane protein